MILPQSVPARFQRKFSFDLAALARHHHGDGEDAVAIVTALWRSVAGYGAVARPCGFWVAPTDLVINNTLHAAALARVLPLGSFESLPCIGICSIISRTTECLTRSVR